MMSLNQLETQALGSIADGLAGSDPRLASILTIFSQLADSYIAAEQAWNGITPDRPELSEYPNVSVVRPAA